MKDARYTPFARVYDGSPHAINFEDDNDRMEADPYTSAQGLLNELASWKLRVAEYPRLLWDDDKQVLSPEKAHIFTRLSPTAEGLQSIVDHAGAVDILMSAAFIIAGHPAGSPPNESVMFALLKTYFDFRCVSSWLPDPSAIEVVMDVVIRNFCEPISFFGPKEFISSIAYSFDDTHIISGSDDHTIRRWDVVSRRQVPNHIVGAHPAPITAVLWSRHSKTTIASASRDGAIIVWNVETQQVLEKSFDGVCGSINSIAWSADGKYIYYGAENATVYIWSLDSAPVRHQHLKGHRGPVRSVALSPDGSRLASGSRQVSSHLGLEDGSG
ncbi:hypothetical protein HGRIS_008893 [Hohenbuehelia grisea]|uniref:WD40 repeat-like protein n=1 Tax=Hohenbuehelia grisea TaxID=104357 RepID=A0ABR3IZI1_9AGAR